MAVAVRAAVLLLPGPRLRVSPRRLLYSRGTSSGSHSRSGRGTGQREAEVGPEAAPVRVWQPTQVAMRLLNQLETEDSVGVARVQGVLRPLSCVTPQPAVTYLSIHPSILLSTCAPTRLST